MSVNYSLQAATATIFSILHVLVLWKGSLWKLLWRELLMWLILFILINLLYYFLIKGSEIEGSYVSIVQGLSKFELDGTIMFLLSFLNYNSLTRWSDTYNLLMWPENIALTFNQYFNEKSMTSEKEARNLRNAIVRYITTFYILIFRDVSTEVRQWFPTLQHLVDSKILTQDELQLLTSSHLAENSCHYWIPIDWIALIMKKRYRPKYILDSEGNRIRNPRESIMSQVHYMEFMRELCKLRGKVSDVLSYDWVPLPLAFIQTITVFVYSTLILSTIQIQLQIVDAKLDSYAIITNIFVNFLSTIPTNVLYLSFLRISQVVINPFGQDDDDFETPYLIDRHFNVLQEILCKEPDAAPNITPPPAPVGSPNSKAQMEMLTRTRNQLGHTLASALLSGIGSSRKSLRRPH